MARRTCVSCKNQTGKMRNYKVLKILLLYNVLETVYIAQASDSRTHAFVHVDGDLRYLMDGVSMEMQEFIREEDSSAISFTDLSEENLNAYASPIAFHPPMLNFQSHPVGMPRMERVVVQNLSPDTSIHMLSISGNTLHTHCSFFQEKVIPPGSNTSFDVVLLAREEGIVEDTLFIHTSLGSFKFQVSAVGVANPFRLRPFVGVRMPLNSSYSPIIYMHNPYSSTLQLTEMYSSGGDLHLELPQGEFEAPRSLWQIPPYETRAVIKANFIARTEKNHTAFIRIRTNTTEQDYLLLPIEVDVTAAPGIYCPTEVLDFGVLRSHDKSKVLTLSLLNSGQKHVHIVNVIATPVNDAVDVKFEPVKVPPDTVFSTQVANITFNPSKALYSKQCCGKIVIKSKNNQYKLQIPYQVKLLNGSLDFNKNSTRFYVGLQNGSHYREFNVTNNFNVYVIIYNVSIQSEEAEEYFRVKFHESVVLRPAQTATVAYLSLKPSDLQLTSYLRLHTNISHFDIPLLCFTGKLRVFLPHAINESFIDFGTLGVGDKRTAIFAVINENPIDVNLKFWGSNTTKSYVELVGVDKGNASTLPWRQNFSAMARSLILKPQHYAIFRIGVTAPDHEGIFNGLAFVETQYEKINLTYSLRTAKGALQVDELFFENSFPGKISTQSLYVQSTFSHPMTITSIATVPEDSRFVFDSLKYGSLLLHPNSKNMVGKIHFDHRKYCKQKCYSGLPTTTLMGHQWLLGMALPSAVGDMDGDLFRTLCKRWNSLLDLEERLTNITLRIDTTEVRGYLLKAHASLQWPRLFSRYRLKFPITQIGNHTVKDFTLENPSSLPILVQVVPVSLYPNPTNIINALKEKYGEDFGYNAINKDTDVFSLEDLEENNPNPDNHIPAYRKSLEEFFGIQSHKKSIAMLLTPGMRVRIQVGFTPQDDSLKSSLILIRNNLTVMDALLVQGQGGYGQIKFGNISPGSESVLMFELTERLLKDCKSDGSLKYVPPHFTVRRAFTARNTGALPIYIKGFDINGKACMGYGFRVLNCQGFELKPNASKKIDIAYTPDFSLTVIQRILNIHTSQGPDGQQYTLMATLPKHMLTYCSNSLPRPYWEVYAYYSCILFTVGVLLISAVMAYMDGSHILHNTFFPFITVGIHAEKMEKENVFDLNALCSTPLDNNSYAKENGVRRKKEAGVEAMSEINLSSVKTNGISRKRDPLVYEEAVFENNKPSKKKNCKTRQPAENYPDLIEIKKSQPRNSWTRFLKPPFSFHSRKPSVATQTNTDDPNKSFKELDLLGDENMNCFMNNEKSKIKGENKYPESRKKGNDSLPEEETSSTTTESSTTESDISEKDNRLPDICVTSKPQKSKYSKNKSRDASRNSPNLSNSLENIIAQDKLSCKSKFDTNYNDLIRPSLLELPYKLKSVPEDEKRVTELPSKSNSSTWKEVKDPRENSNERVPSQKSFPNYVPATPSESVKFSSHPPTYSAAVSKDISKGISCYEINRSTMEPLKIVSGNSKHKQNFVSPATNLFNPKPPTQIPSVSEQLKTEDKLSGSKLMSWMLKSCESSNNKSDIPQDSSLFTHLQIPKQFDSSNPSSWSDSTQKSLMQNLLVDHANGLDSHQKQDRVYNNWPGFNLTPVTESFWDVNYSPHSDSWTGRNKQEHQDNFCMNLLPNNIWENSGHSEWKPDSSWTSPSDTVISSNNDLHPGNSLPDNKISSSGEFDPFHTPNALWVAPLEEEVEGFRRSPNSTTWSFSLFSDPSQVLTSDETTDPNIHSKI